MLGEIEGKRKKELQRMTCLDDMDLNKLWEIGEDRGAWSAAVHGVTKCQT